MEKIKKLRQVFKKEKIDGYLISKNDQFYIVSFKKEF